MAELISREALLSELEERFDGHQKRSQRNVGAGFVEVHKEWAAMAMGVAECLDVVRKLPTIEAEPVKHGRWDEDGRGIIICSKCSRAYNLVASYTNYCPNCGAKMDLEG